MPNMPNMPRWPECAEYGGAFFCFGFYFHSNSSQWLMLMESGKRQRQAGVRVHGKTLKKKKNVAL